MSNLGRRFRIVEGTMVEVPMNPQGGRRPGEFDPDPFTYIPPSAESAEVMEFLSAQCRGLLQSVMANVPNCAERTLAIRKLQEFRMWVNCAIAMEQERGGS